ncbi:MAG: hypothetical protein ABWY35_07140 [Pseudorhodoplanes sp.]
MIDNTRADRSAQTGLSSRAAWRLLTRRRRTLILLIETALILFVAVVGHLTGRELGRRNLEKREELVIELREELQKRGGELGRRTDQLTSLQAKLNSVQAALDAIVPSENTYNIVPNQSLLVGGGRLTVGLVGQPSNLTVTLNINGKEHALAAGNAITLAVDDKTECQLTLQSFDMFKATINSQCAARKS